MPDQIDLLDSEVRDIRDFEDGGTKPAEPRLKTLKAALNLYNTTLSDDGESSRKRARWTLCLMAGPLIPRTS